MSSNGERIKASEEMAACVEGLVRACVTISYYDHVKIDLARSASAAAQGAAMADAILEVRRSLETRAALKNRLDQLLSVALALPEATHAATLRVAP